jgi:hypothetical protein
MLIFPEEARHPDADRLDVIGIDEGRQVSAEFVADAPARREHGRAQGEGLEGGEAKALAERRQQHAADHLHAMDELGLAELGQQLEIRG